MASDTARGLVFDKFYQRTGRKRYGPEFVDSLVRTMQISKGVCLTERVWAWTRWRTWANSSETAMSGWQSEGTWELDQTDCALDLWWFESGKSLEYVEGATKEHRATERDRREVQSRKMAISRAYEKLQARGQVELSRGRILALVTPHSLQVVDNRVLVTDFVTSLNLSNPEFTTWWKTTEPESYAEWEKSRTSYFKLRKIARTCYQRWKKPVTKTAPNVEEPVTKNAPIIIDVKTINKEKLNIPTPTPPPVRPESAGNGHAQEGRGNSFHPNPPTAAQTLIHILATSHADVQTPGDIGKAVEHATTILAQAPDPEVKCAEIRKSHAAHMEFWKLQRKTSPAQFIPHLARWLATGQYLYPPGEEAIQAAKGQSAVVGNGRKEPAWLTEAKKRVAGESV